MVELFIYCTLNITVADNLLNVIILFILEIKKYVCTITVLRILGHYLNLTFKCNFGVIVLFNRSH